MSVGYLLPDLIPRLNICRTRFLNSYYCRTRVLILEPVSPSYYRRGIVLVRTINDPSPEPTSLLAMVFVHSISMKLIIFVLVTAANGQFGLSGVSRSSIATYGN